MKTCFKCGEEKSANDFYVHAQMADGRLGKCKSCCRAYEKAKRLSDPLVQERERKRSKTPLRKEHLKNNAHRWRLNNPDGYKAHYTLTNAVRDGKIERKPCEICGAKSHAHHDDYSKPLEVRWLCALHHHRHHAHLKDTTKEDHP